MAGRHSGHRHRAVPFAQVPEESGSRLVRTADVLAASVLARARSRYRSGQEAVS